MLQNPSKTRLKSTRAEEIYFEHEELFFSITDLKGVILTGNKVFIRVSQYSKEELIGASHNIVRHGDMPRAAFKVLWTTIQSGEKIAAYVKNRARDGSYYWVVATLIPIKDGYLSIRFRPTSSLKGIVEKIYGEMLALEEKEGMERAIDYLLDQLQSLGFQDYQSFMVHMLTTELQSRDQFLCARPKKEEQSKLKGLLSIELLQKDYHKIFNTLCSLQTLQSHIHENNQQFLKLAQRINIVSLNALIASSRMGQEGQTLLVLANEIQARVSETQTLTADIKVWLDELQQEIRNITFAISLTKLQFEMISFFYQECESSSMEINFIDRTENQKNQVFLWSLLGASTQEAFEKIDGLLNRLKKCESLLVHLNQNMITLRVAYTAGKTEISRFADTRQVDPVFEELGKLTETAKEDSKKFGEMIEQSKNKLMDLHLLDKTVQTKVQGFKKEFKFS